MIFDQNGVVIRSFPAIHAIDRGIDLEACHTEALDEQLSIRQLVVDNENTSHEKVRHSVTAVRRNAPDTVRSR